MRRSKINRITQLIFRYIIWQEHEFVMLRVTLQVSLFNLRIHLKIRVSSARVSPSFDHMIYIHIEWWRYHTVDGSVLYL